MSGQKLNAFKLDKESGTYEVNVKYPAGTYLVQLKSDTGIVVQKMIIQ